MHTLIIDVDILEDCLNSEEPWMCVYKKHEELFQNSIGKMLNTDALQFFKNTKKELSEILKIVEVYKNKSGEIHNILQRVENMCPIDNNFSVYFLPAPFDFGITQYSQKLGLFIFFGIGGDDSFMNPENLSVLLPHEYAHIVRLHTVLLPEGIDSPYQMNLANLTILEGLGITFSAWFNNDLKKESLWKYIPFEKDKWQEYMERENEYIELLKNRKDEKLTQHTILEFYGPERKGYAIGSLCIFSLIEKGYSICELDKMKESDILEKL